MKHLTGDELFAAVRKTATRVTKEEILHRGLDALEATGLPLEGVASLARSVGLELEDIAYSFGSSHSVPHRVPPVEIEADVVRKLTEIHEVIVKQAASRLALLSQTERELYDAASEYEPFGGSELCRRTRTHDLNSRTKQCLANLVKLGLLRKASGRKGYLRTPAKS